MFRPPRPPSKNSTPLSALPLPLGRQIQIGVSRFTSEQNAKSVGKYPKKTQKSGCFSEQNYQTAIQSPKFSLQIKENLQSNINKTIAVNPSGFKIRYLSSRGRRSKQNMEPNENKMSEYIMRIEMKDHSVKKDFKAAIVDGRIQYQTDIMQKNHRQLQFHSAKIKTGVVKLSQPNASKACIILSQSIFHQPALSDNFVMQLKNLAHSIMMTQQGLSIAIKMQTQSQISDMRQLIESNNLPIDYIIWNNQKSISSHNVMNLQKISETKNFIIFHDSNQYSADWYATGDVQTRYCYYSGNLEQISKAFALLKLQEDPANDRLSVSYNKNSQITNHTKKYLQSQHITNKIKLFQNKILTRATSMPTCTSTSTNSIKEFDQQYRNKMIQLAKLLISQQKQEQNRVNRFNTNQYMRIKLSEDVSTLMDTYVACNTAYQFVSEIVRNNCFNCSQISQFREKCKNFTSS